MFKKELIIPIYLKTTIVLVGFFVLFTMMYMAKEIIVPMVFSIILAIVLHPVVNFFVRKKINRVIAILITLSLTFIAIAGFGTLIFSQAIRFSDSLPILLDKITLMVNQGTIWASGYFDINPQKIHTWVINTKGEILSSISASIGKTLVTFGSTIVVLFLIPVYVFLLLFYHSLILDFIHKLFGKGNQSKVSEIVLQVKNVIQGYLVGLVIETGIIAILQIATLLILGIDYAILLGIIGALLNLIPYIGGLVAVAIPMMIALVTKESGWYALYVLIIYYVIQLVDNNLIVPKIVASKVKINALFSIIVVIAGNALWGIPGMFLSIPLLAIVKLIFDHIESMKPWGFLLGDTMPPIMNIKPMTKIKTILKKNKK
ncbi:MAG: AI-2E family transporter [Bacteroidota bacterium]